MSSLADRTLRRLREARHNRLARDILATPPVSARDDGVIVFSMIGTRVLLPYLVAAKSLDAQLGRGRFAVLDDGTLTTQDRELLAEHLDRPEVFSLDNVVRGECPRGGCWERLLTLLELRRDAYVIQLDSDTVTLGPVAEVTAAIDAGRDFTLLGGEDAHWTAAADYAADVGGLPATAHVQTFAEAVLEQIDAGLPRPRKYVRGCAGFSGFAPSGLGPEVAKRASREAVALLGAKRWSEWGTEQVMSNLIIANEGEPVLLPYERYLNFWNEPIDDAASFVHFVGTYRYHGGAYARATARAIRALSS